jgi:flavin reductase (DIM6/NTAB) family NADH-FMN oxidoreductase RutF
VRERECVLNLPSPDLWQNVERLVPLNGADPVPESKQGSCRHEPRKFESAGLTPQPADAVAPPRVRECPIQLEAVLADVHEPAAGGPFAILETTVEQVHVNRKLLRPGTRRIIAERWSPLLYVFRHYVAARTHLGLTFRAED